MREVRDERNVQMGCEMIEKQEERDINAPPERKRADIGRDGAFPPEIPRVYSIRINLLLSRTVARTTGRIVPFMSMVRFPRGGNGPY